VPVVGLSDPAPTSAPSQKSSSGISWMGWNCPPGVSLLGQYFFFSSAPFFPSWIFFPSSVFFFSFLFLFFREQFFYHFFFGKLLPTPTHLPPFFLPTHLPPPSYWPPPHPPPFAFTSIQTASNLERAWVAKSLSSLELQELQGLGASRVP
jgi:hypothetical protein